MEHFDSGLSSDIIETILNNTDPSTRNVLSSGGYLDLGVENAFLIQFTAV